MAGHIKYGKVASIATSDEDYYPAAKQVGEYVNGRAKRTDITAVVSVDAGMGAPACFIPSLAEVHVNPGVVPMGDPSKVNLPDRLWALEHAAAMGAMTHEAAHARHTKFDPRDLMDEHGATRKMIDVITTLEEPRIEAQALRFRPADRVYLRGCAMEIVGRDFVIPDTAYGAAAAAALLLARVDAKVLDKREVKGFRDEIRGVLGDDTLATLEELWQRFLRLADRDYEGMVQIATEWLDALGEDADDASGMVGESMMGEALPGDPGEGEGEGSEGEGEGEGSGDGEGDSEGEGGKGSGKGFGDKIKAMAAEAEVKIDTEVVGERRDERAARRGAERAADRERGKESTRAHAEAFKGGKSVHGYSPTGFAHLTGEREPNSDERRAARSLAGSLERIDYRDRAVAKVTSAVPPGRLRGRVAVQEAAARSMGRDFAGESWQGKRRQRVDSTPLTIGFAVDISGSMGSAMAPLASTQWVVSTAGAHIDAKVASVHFGDTVHGVTPAGVKEKTVRMFYPGDGSEAFKDAALALDRELNLLDGRGARLLILASDGCFVCGTDKAYADAFIPLAQSRGVAVIFLDFTGSMAYGNYGAEVVDCVGKSPTQVAALVGKACIAEIRKMDSRV
jgi:hypothetical protein